MKRSHLGVLFITLFALAVLGAAAGTLHSAHPTQIHKTGTASDPGTSGSKGSPQKAKNHTDTQSSSHYFLPDPKFSSELATGSTHATSTFIRLAIAVLLLLLVGGALSLWWLTRDDDPVTVEPTLTNEDHRIESPSYTTPPDAAHVPADNDVYRAWQTMIATADPDNHRRRTPGELAHAAIEAGLPEPAVRTLTRLFQTVRYGEEPPTPERERDAQHALHTIQYADGQGETNDEPEPGRE